MAPVHAASTRAAEIVAAADRLAYAVLQAGGVDERAVRPAADEFLLERIAAAMEAERILDGGVELRSAAVARIRVYLRGGAPWHAAPMERAATVVVTQVRAQGAEAGAAALHRLADLLVRRGYSAEVAQAWAAEVGLRAQKLLAPARRRGAA